MEVHLHGGRLGYKYSALCMAEGSASQGCSSNSPCSCVLSACKLMKVASATLEVSRPAKVLFMSMHPQELAPEQAPIGHRLVRWRRASCCEHDQVHALISVSVLLEGLACIHWEQPACKYLPAARLSTCLSTYQRVHYGQHKREGDEENVQPAGGQLGIKVVAGHDESHAAGVEDEGPNDQHKGQSFLWEQGGGR